MFFLCYLYIILGLILWEKIMSCVVVFLFLLFIVFLVWVEMLCVVFYDIDYFFYYFVSEK